jgi:hypothetical protein
MLHNNIMVTSSRPAVSLLWLLLIPVGAVIGGTLSPGGLARAAGSAASSSGIVAGGVVGAIAAVVLLAMSWRNATRRRKALALHPGAVLVEGADVEETGRALASIRNGIAPRGHAYTVAFAPDRVHVYHDHDLTPVTTIAWADVVSIREDVVTASSKPRPALVVDVRTAEGVVALPLVIAVSNGFQSAEGLVAKAASGVDAVRRASGSAVGATASTAGSPPPPSIASTGYATPLRRELLPGVASARLKTWARVPPYIGGAIVLAMFAMRLFSRPGTTSGWTMVAFAAIASMSLLALLLFVLASRAEKKEREAGYTLNRLGEISVDQLDPTTGYVIRRAGQPQLTKEQERAELQRVSALV